MWRSGAGMPRASLAFVALLLVVQPDMARGAGLAVGKGAIVKRAANVTHANSTQMPRRLSTPAHGDEIPRSLEAAAASLEHGQQLANPDLVQCVTDADCPRHYACDVTQRTTQLLRLMHGRRSDHLCRPCGEVYTSTRDLERCADRQRYLAALSDPGVLVCRPGRDDDCPIAWGCGLGGNGQCLPCAQAWPSIQPEKLERCMSRPSAAAVSKDFLDVDAILDPRARSRMRNFRGSYKGFVLASDVRCRPGYHRDCPEHFGCGGGMRCAPCERLSDDLMRRKCLERRHYTSAARPQDIWCRDNTECPRGFVCNGISQLCSSCRHMYAGPLQTAMMTACLHRTSDASTPILVAPPLDAASSNTSVPTLEPASSVSRTISILYSRSPLLAMLRTNKVMRSHRQVTKLEEVLQKKAQQEMACDDLTAEKDADARAEVFACDPRVMEKGDGSCRPCGRVDVPEGIDGSGPVSVCADPDWSWQWRGLGEEAATSPAVEALGSRDILPDDLWNNQFTIVARVRPKLHVDGWQVAVEYGRGCHGMRLGLLDGHWAFSSAYGCGDTIPVVTNNTLPVLDHWPLVQSNRTISAAVLSYVAMTVSSTPPHGNSSTPAHEAVLTVDGEVVASMAWAGPALSLDTGGEQSQDRNGKIGASTIDGGGENVGPRADVWKGSVCGVAMWKGLLIGADLTEMTAAHASRRVVDRCGAAAWSWQGAANTQHPVIARAPSWGLPFSMWDGDFTVMVSLTVALNESLPVSLGAPGPWQYAVLRGGCGGLLIGLHGTRFAYGRACGPIYTVDPMEVPPRDGQSYILAVVYDYKRNETRFYVDGDVRATSAGRDSGFTNSDTEVFVGSAGVAQHNGEDLGEWQGVVCDVSSWGYAQDDATVRLNAIRHATATLSDACSSPKWLWRGPAVRGVLENTVAGGWVLSAEAAMAISTIDELTLERGFTVSAKVLYKATDARSFQVIFAQDGCGGVMVGVWRGRWMVGETCGDFVTFLADEDDAAQAGLQTPNTSPTAPLAGVRARHNTPYVVMVTCNYGKCVLRLDGELSGSVRVDGGRFGPGWPGHRLLFGKTPPGGTVHIGSWLGPEEGIGQREATVNDPGVIQFVWDGTICSVGIWEGVPASTTAHALAAAERDQHNYDDCSVSPSWMWEGVSSPADPQVTARTSDRNKRIRLIDELVPKPPPAIDERPSNSVWALLRGKFTLRVKVKTGGVLEGKHLPGCKGRLWRGVDRVGRMWESQKGRVCEGPGDCTRFAVTETILSHGNGCGGLIFGLWKDSWMFGRRCGPIYPAPIPAARAHTTYFITISMDDSRQHARVFVDGLPSGELSMGWCIGDCAAAGDGASLSRSLANKWPMHIGSQSTDGSVAPFRGRICVASVWKGLLPAKAVLADISAMRLRSLGDDCGSAPSE